MQHERRSPQQEGPAQQEGPTQQEGPAQQPSDALLSRQQRSFYGVDLSALHGAAGDEFFRQPIVVRQAEHSGAAEADGHAQVLLCVSGLL